MDDNLLADLASMVGLINKHSDMPTTFNVYSTKPHGKMCFIASEIVRSSNVANDAERTCLNMGFYVRSYKKNNEYIVEINTITAKHTNLHRAKLEACVRVLEGILLSPNTDSLENTNTD